MIKTNTKEISRYKNKHCIIEFKDNNHTIHTLAVTVLRCKKNFTEYYDLVKQKHYWISSISIISIEAVTW